MGWLQETSLARIHSVTFHSFLTWLPFKRILLRQPPDHSFSQAQRQPPVLRSYEWRIEALATSFQSQMGSKFLHRGFANLHPNIPGLVDWIGCLAGWFTVGFYEEHLWNHQCVAIKLSRKDVWYTDPVYMRMFCQPMCNWKTRIKYFDISTIESI